MSNTIFTIEVNIGGTWTIRLQALTMERLMQQADLYAGRALEAGYEVRIAPYVLDESLVEMLDASDMRKV